MNDLRVAYAARVRVNSCRSLLILGWTLVYISTSLKLGVSCSRQHFTITEVGVCLRLFLATLPLPEVEPGRYHGEHVAFSPFLLLSFSWPRVQCLCSVTAEPELGRSGLQAQGFLYWSKVLQGKMDFSAYCLALCSSKSVTDFSLSW